METPICLVIMAISSWVQIRRIIVCKPWNDGSGSFDGRSGAGERKQFRHGD